MERMIIFLTVLLFFLVVNHLCLSFVKRFVKPRIPHPMDYSD